MVYFTRMKINIVYFATIKIKIIDWLSAITDGGVNDEN